VPIEFAAFKSSDETGWTTYNIGQHLFSISASLLGTTLAAAGGRVYGFAATAGSAALDILNTLASQSSDAQLFSLSLAAAGQGQTFFKQIVTNTEAGLSAVITSQTPQVPSGRIVSISAVFLGAHCAPTIFCPGGLPPRPIHDVLNSKHPGRSRPCTRLEAFSDKDIHHWGASSSLGRYRRTTVQNPHRSRQGRHIGRAGSQTTVRLTFLSGDGGLMPEAQSITYSLTARAPDATYRQDSRISNSAPPSLTRTVTRLTRR